MPTEGSFLLHLQEEVTMSPSSSNFEDLLGLVADRDNLKTSFGLQKAIAFGVDPRFSVPKHVSGN